MQPPGVNQHAKPDCPTSVRKGVNVQVLNQLNGRSTRARLTANDLASLVNLVNLRFAQRSADVLAPSTSSSSSSDASSLERKLGEPLSQLMLPPKGVAEVDSEHGSFCACIKGKCVKNQRSLWYLFPGKRKSYTQLKKDFFLETSFFTTSAAQ